MGTIFILGGLAGSSVGVWIFSYLKQYGQIDLVISLCYIVILGFIGISMAIENFSSFTKPNSNEISSFAKGKKGFFRKITI